MREYSPDKNPILIKCKGAGEIDIDSLTKFQGNLKTLTASNRDSLLSVICEKGFYSPMLIWKDGDINNLLDGTQRLTVLNYMRENGWEIPPLPYVSVEADSEQDAREKLLSISSQYGDFDKDVLSEWLESTNEDMYRFLEADEPPVPEDYHPILDPEVGSSDISDEEVEEAKGKLRTQMDKKGKKEYETVCPHCGEEFIVSV